jgi:hypothetical protein
MTTAARDRISVDLRGLKVALLERARAGGVSPSDFVRSVVAGALDQSLNPSPDGAGARLSSEAHARVRVSLRMHQREASALFSAARSAGLPLGTFVTGLVAGIPALERGDAPRHHVAALIASNAEISTLARNVHHLAALLRQGSVRAAQEYQSMLGNLEMDVRNHLALAAEVLCELRPRRSAPAPRFRR